jgi:hypothetical protein
MHRLGGKVSTLHSFENAMHRLGGKVAIMNPQQSSVQIGESFEGGFYLFFLDIFLFLSIFNFLSGFGIFVNLW